MSRIVTCGDLQRERERWEISKFCHWDFKGSALCSRNEDSAVAGPTVTSLRTGKFRKSVSIFGRSKRLVLLPARSDQLLGPPNMC